MISADPSAALMFLSGFVAICSSATTRRIKLIGWWTACSRSSRPTACAASASLSAAPEQTRRDAPPCCRCSKKQCRQPTQRYRAMHEPEAREAPELEAPLHMPLASSSFTLSLFQCWRAGSIAISHYHGKHKLAYGRAPHPTAASYNRMSMDNNKTSSCVDFLYTE